MSDLNYVYDIKTPHVLITRLRRFWEKIPNVFSLFFGLPTIHFEAMDANVQDLDFSFKYTEISIHKSHFRLLPSYRDELLKTLAANAILPQDVFKNTVLGDDAVWRVYLGLASAALKWFTTGDVPWLPLHKTWEAFRARMDDR